MPMAPPPHPIAMCLLSDLLQEVTLLEKAAAFNPNQVDIQLHLGSALAQKGEIEKALEICNSIITSQNSHPRDLHQFI